MLEDDLAALNDAAYAALKAVARRDVVTVEERAAILRVARITDRFKVAQLEAQD